MKVNVPALATFLAAAILAALPATSQAPGGAAPAPTPSSPSKKSSPSSSFSSSSSSPSSDRILRATLVLDAPVDAVWKLWTTEDGVKSFFAPGCRIEPKVDGLYEIWFNPAAPAGERGGEAWSTFVLPNLVWRVAHGPIDWKARPEVKPVAGTLKVDLSPAP